MRKAPGPRRSLSRGLESVWPKSSNLCTQQIHKHESRYRIRHKPPGTLAKRSSRVVPTVRLTLVFSIRKHPPPSSPLLFFRRREVPPSLACTLTPRFEVRSTPARKTGPLRTTPAGTAPSRPVRDRARPCGRSVTRRQEMCAASPCGGPRRALSIAFACCCSEKGLKRGVDWRVWSLLVYLSCRASCEEGGVGCLLAFFPLCLAVGFLCC